MTLNETIVPLPGLYPEENNETTATGTSSSSNDNGFQEAFRNDMILLALLTIFGLFFYFSMRGARPRFYTDISRAMRMDHTAATATKTLQEVQNLFFTRKVFHKRDLKPEKKNQPPSFTQRTKSDVRNDTEMTANNNTLKSSEKFSNELEKDSLSIVEAPTDERLALSMPQRQLSHDEAPATATTEEEEDINDDNERLKIEQEEMMESDHSSTTTTTTTTSPTMSSPKKPTGEPITNSRSCESLPESYLVCSICLGDYRVGEEVAWSHNPDCPHTFHAECLTQWLLKNDECPLCRSMYHTKSDLVVPAIKSSSSSSSTAAAAAATATATATAEAVDDGNVYEDDIDDIDDQFVDIENGTNWNTQS